MGLEPLTVAKRKNRPKSIGRLQKYIEEKNYLRFPLAMIAMIMTRKSAPITQ